MAGLNASANALLTQGLLPGTSYGLNLIDPDRFGKPNPSEYAYSQIPIGGSAYSAARNFHQGNYASGAVAAVETAISIAFAIYGAVQGANVAGLSQQEQLDFAVGAYAQHFSTPFQRGFWSGIGYVGRILGHDLAAAAVGAVVKPFVFAKDVWGLGQSVWALDPGLVARSAFNTVYDAIIPTYGLYGGAGYGLSTWPGLIGRLPEPLNRVDWASFIHDINTRNLQWATHVWSSSPLLPPGPFGLAYGILGTPPFVLTGLLQ